MTKKIKKTDVDSMVLEAAKVEIELRRELLDNLRRIQEVESELRGDGPPLNLPAKVATEMRRLARESEIATFGRAWDWINPSRWGR
jgi:hypothetical protein